MGKQGQKKRRAFERKVARRKAIDERVARARAKANSDDVESLIELFNATLSWRQATYTGDYREHVQQAFNSAFVRGSTRGSAWPLPTVKDAGTAHHILRTWHERRRVQELADLLG